jgi:phosphatidate phosphatase APP1
MAGLGQIVAHFFLQRKARMIGTDNKLHDNPFWLFSGVSRALRVLAELAEFASFAYLSILPAG